MTGSAAEPVAQPVGLALGAQAGESRLRDVLTAAVPPESGEPPTRRSTSYWKHDP